jgi:acetyltransferase-like isoleucine patch superfamily enzyme
MRAAAAVRGVQVGSEATFFGHCLLRRASDSVLVIGDDCRFRSAAWSSLAGINRPCVLATLRRRAHLRLGAGCALSGTVVAAAESIVLGDRVYCGANVTVTDTDWHGVTPGTRATWGAAAPVVIEDDVWLGMGVTVLKGVTIGHGTVVSAGSVVVTSLPAGVIAAGNPARQVGDVPSTATGKDPGAVIGEDGRT